MRKKDLKWCAFYSGKSGIAFIIGQNSGLKSQSLYTIEKALSWWTGFNRSCLLAIYCMSWRQQLHVVMERGPSIGCAHSGCMPYVMPCVPNKKSLNDKNSGFTSNLYFITVWYSTKGLWTVLVWWSEIAHCRVTYKIKWGINEYYTDKSHVWLILYKANSSMTDGTKRTSVSTLKFIYWKLAGDKPKWNTSCSSIILIFQN